MGDLHQLCARKRLIYKCSNCIGIKEWYIDAGIIAPLDSTAQTMEGHHYYRYMHLHKKCFDTVVQFRFDKMKSYFIFFRVLEKHRLAL